jgi:hypothetical protein
VIPTRLSGAPCAQPMDTPAPSVPHAHLTPSQALRRDLLAVRWAVLFRVVGLRLASVAAAWLVALLPVHGWVIVMPTLALLDALICVPISYVLRCLHADALAEEAGGSSADANL